MLAKVKMIFRVVFDVMMYQEAQGLIFSFVVTTLLGLIVTGLVIWKMVL